MADKEPTVQADEVLRSVQGGVALRGIQRAGLWLAGGVGLLVFIICISLLIFLSHNYPNLPSEAALKESLSTTNGLAVVNQYKELSGVVTKDVRDVFQTIVTQALLPVFTAILGYIFALSDTGGKKQ